MASGVDRLENKIKVILLLCGLFTAALLSRIYIFASYEFFPSGDVGQWASFARQIIMKGGIPEVNALYFPGSRFVYPPLLFVVFVGLSHLLRMDVFLVMLPFTIIIDSASVIIIFLLGKILFNLRAALIAAFIFAFFQPHLYMFTWGGYPSLFSSFLTLLIVYLLIINDNSKTLRHVAISLLMAMIALSHHLTFFVVSYMLFFYMLFNIANAKVDTIKYLVLALLPTVIVALFWYLPRIDWVFGVAGRSYPIRSVSSYIMERIVDLLQPLGILILFVGSSIVGIRHLGKNHKSLFWSWIGAPLTLMVLKLGDPVTFIRISYTTFYPLILLISATLSKMYPSNNKESTISSILGKKNVVITIFIISIISIYAISSVDFAKNSYVFYTSGDYRINIDALNWIRENTPPNATFVANVQHSAAFISGYSGRPAFGATSLIWLTQPTEAAQAIVADIIVKNMSSPQSQDLIRQYHVNYIFILKTPSSAHYAQPDAKLFEAVYNDPYVVIFKVK